MNSYNIENLYNSIEHECLMNDCQEPIYRCGICKEHYEMKVMCGTSDFDEIKNIKKCTLNGCIRKHFSKGYCNKHYREVFPEKFNKNKTEKKKEYDICKITGCSRREMSRGFCNAHNVRF